MRLPRIGTIPVMDLDVPKIRKQRYVRRTLKTDETMMDLKIFIKMMRSLVFVALGSSLLLGCTYLDQIHQKAAPEDMVYIPGGYFIMGSSDKDGTLGIQIGLDEIPQQRSYVKGYYIDRFEVTNARYYEYVKAGGEYTPATWDYRQHPSGKIWPMDTPAPGEENHPVGDVDWYDAQAYCLWAKKRLPTEAEWEKAARGTEGIMWPWGNHFDPAKANTQESGLQWSRPVGSLPQGISPYGLYDMVGNAWEWTAGWYKPYPGNTLKRAAFGEKYRVLRGGSYLTSVQPFARVAARYAPKLLPMEQRDSEWHTGFDIGFRCAKNP